MKALFYYARGLIPVSMKWVKQCVDARQVQIQVEDLQSIPGTTDVSWKQWTTEFGRGERRVHLVCRQRRRELGNEEEVTKRAGCAHELDGELHSCPETGKRGRLLGPRFVMTSLRYDNNSAYWYSQHLHTHQKNSVCKM
eukprot:CAMPEP_0170172756 /NCGR_PEP_ID=MMETSP0040_2-20121228/6020_1 /TAXON_ID=641309 /ORGANISM="Lotharella oceanica, Strain CCMP622" /LENGTH=138 /DNA_ID=CAMNT_0010413579 /DNA_START=49 /DNA_END=465 /DNA_ORIENTATION=-